MSSSTFKAAVLFKQKTPLKILDINMPKKLDFGQVLVKILYRYPDIIAANSQELSGDLEKYTGRKIHTLYNPCYEKVKIKKKRYRSKNIINILNISRFEDQKDHFTLLKAINISEIRNQINLTLVGYGRNYQKIKSCPFYPISPPKMNIPLTSLLILHFFQRLYTFSMNPFLLLSYIMRKSFLTQVRFSMETKTRSIKWQVHLFSKLGNSEMTFLS